MGIVSDHLRRLVEKQVTDHRLVVWFDPEGHYEAFVRSLDLPETPVAVYDGSFLALRWAIDSHLSEEDPPRLVVYVPLAEEATHHALVELTRAGVVLKPGQNPWQRNTRLSVVAKNAFEALRGKAEAMEIEKQVSAGKLSLADLDRLGEGGPGGGQAVIQLLFDTADPQAVALQLIGGDKDEKIAARNALREVASTLGHALGVDLSLADTCDKVREMLARHVLSSDLIASLRGRLPQQLETLRVAPQEGPAREACVRLARAWRARADLRQRYAGHAGQLERELGLSGIGFELEQIRECETFPALETAAQALVEQRGLEDVPWSHDTAAELLGLIDERLNGFWAACPDTHPQIQPRWRLIRTAIELIDIAAVVESGLKAASQPDEFLRRYTEGSASEPPWCLLDGHHRHLERLCQALDLGADERHEALERLVARARREYARVGGALAEAYLRALAQAKFRAQGFRSQREVYSVHVAPALKDGKTAYILVDALRFEMARDVTRDIGDGFEAVLHCVMGVAPSVTETGMAAVLPGAESGVEMVPARDRKLGVRIGETALNNRSARMRWIRERAGLAAGGERARVSETKMDQVLSMSRPVRQAIEEADLVVVTSQEIDDLCESDNVTLARRVLDDMLGLLPRAIRALAALGCKKIIFVADHGHVFGEELGSEMKMDPPGGETVDLHRRVWVGRGGASDPSFLRTTAAALGWGGDLEVAVPWGLGAFKVPGGGRAYFHGGMSLPETAIPVGVATPKAAPPAASLAGVAWALIPGSKKLTARHFSVQVQGTARELFGFEPPRVRLEMRGGSEVVSVPVAASYGFIDTNGDVQLRSKGPAELEPDTVTLMTTRDISEKTVSVHLLDVGTGRELARLQNIEVALLI